MDVWLGWIGFFLNLDRCGSEPVSIPNTGGRFLWTGKRCPPQCGHNDFPSKPHASPGFFMIATGSESTPLLLCPASHTYVFYPQKLCEALVRSLRMQKIDIPAWSIFVGHGHLQHAGGAYNGSPSLRYHLYFKPTDFQLQDGVFFAYGNSLQIGNYGYGVGMEHPSLPRYTHKLSRSKNVPHSEEPDHNLGMKLSTGDAVSGKEPSQASKSKNTSPASSRNDEIMENVDRMLENIPDE